MKFIIVLFFFLGITSFKNVFAQLNLHYNTPKSSYVDPGISDFKKAAETLQQKHIENRDYKDDLQDEVYKIRRQDTFQKYKGELDRFQAELDRLEQRGDWANLGEELRLIDRGIKKMLAGY